MNYQPVSYLQRLPMLPLEHFGDLQERYRDMRPARRAATVLEDAAPALQTVQALLATLGKNPKIFIALERIRSNEALVGKMRACEAKSTLLDARADFIAVAESRLASWRRTIERVAAGEGVVASSGDEFIPAHVPLASAIANLNVIGGYLSIIQLALAEMALLDSEYAAQYQASVTKVRRCATFLSDCELASSIAALVH